MPQANLERRRDLPIWLSLLIILACLAGGGWFVRWYFDSAPISRTVSVPTAQPRDNDTPAERRERRAPSVRRQSPLTAQSPDGVASLGNRQWNAKSGDVLLSARGLGNETRITLSYLRGDVPDDQQRMLLLARRRLAFDPGIREALEITPEQIEKLRAVSGFSGIGLTDAETDRVRDAWQAYLSARGDARDPAQANLLALLRELGAAKLDDTRQAIATRTERIRAILTPEQLERFMSLSASPSSRGQ